MDPATINCKAKEVLDNPRSLLGWPSLGRADRSFTIVMLLSVGENHVIPMLNRACMLEVRDGFIAEGTENHPRWVPRQEHQVRQLPLHSHLNSTSAV